MPTATAAMQRVHMRALFLVPFIMLASRLHLGMVGPVHGCVQNLPATSHHILSHATTCGLLTEARNMLRLSMLFGSPPVSYASSTYECCPFTLHATCWWPQQPSQERSCCAETAHLDTDRPATPPSYDVGARHSPQQLEETLAGIRAAGTLFPGDGLVYQVGARQVCKLHHCFIIAHSKLL